MLKRCVWSKVLSAVLLALITVLTLAALPSTAAARYTGSYSRMYQANGYQYRKYTYYSPQARQYKMHYAVYHPKYPRYVYYYNPDKKVYWGRFCLMTGGYSKLGKCDKRGRIGDIEEGAFPPPGAMPPPEDLMDDQMLPPPEADDTPTPPAPDYKILPFIPEDGDCRSSF